jgi:hypothetical protein
LSDNEEKGSDDEGSDKEQKEGESKNKNEIKRKGMSFLFSNLCFRKKDGS